MSDGPLDDGVLNDALLEVAEKGYKDGFLAGVKHGAGWITAEDQDAARKAAKIYVNDARRALEPEKKSDFTPESMPEGMCPHGRESWTSCPYCIGIGG